MDIALYRPEIPPNTGNIARLSICSGNRMHIIGQPSFSLEESAVKRAGLDYWDQVDLQLHEDWEAFLDHQARHSRGRILLFTKFSTHCYSNFAYRNDDTLVFGQETRGLPDPVKDSIAQTHPEHLLRIPVSDRCRSLNLANAVSIVLYEALRQLDFPGLDPAYPDDSRLIKN